MLTICLLLIFIALCALCVVVDFKLDQIHRDLMKDEITGTIKKEGNFWDA